MKKTYDIQIISIKQLEIDFQNIYDTIKNALHTEDIGIIGDEFMDNFRLYIKEITGFEYEIDEDMIDIICNDFWMWLRNKAKKTSLEASEDMYKQP